MNTQSSPAEPSIIGLLPLFLIGTLLAVFIFRIAKRKGKSPAFAIYGFIPLVNILVAIWLASLTDKAVLEELAALRGKNG